MNPKDEKRLEGVKYGPLDRPGFTDSGVPIHEPLNPDPVNKPRRIQVPLDNGEEKNLSKEEFKKLLYDLASLGRAVRNLKIQLKDLEDSMEKFKTVSGDKTK